MRATLRGLHTVTKDAKSHLADAFALVADDDDDARKSSSSPPRRVSWKAFGAAWAYLGLGDALDASDPNEPLTEPECRAWCRLIEPAADDALGTPQVIGGCLGLPLPPEARLQEGPLELVRPAARRHDAAHRLARELGGAAAHGARARVRGRTAAVGHDGDGDRVILCDNQGEVVHGDKLLGLLALYAKRKGKLSDSVLVATVQSNSGLERSLNNFDVRLARSEVGDRNVAELMKELGANLGGESSGHIIASDHLPTGDGLLSFLLASQAMLETDFPLSVLADEIELAPCIENAYRVLEKTPLESLPELLELVSSEEQSLGKYGRVLLRYSGTEPKIRLLVEALESKQAEEVFHTLQQALRKLLIFA